LGYQVPRYEGPQTLPLEIVRIAKKVGVEKIHLVHSEWGHIDGKYEWEKKVAEMGAYLEYNLSSILFPVLAQTFPQLAAIIKNVGAEHCVLTSDMGQSNNPSPVEGLRILIVNLLQLGISEKEIDLMTRKNPAYLLGLK